MQSYPLSKNGTKTTESYSGCATGVHPSKITAENEYIVLA